MAALAARPDVVKIGLVEAVEAGVVEPGRTSLTAATALVHRGARLAVVTDGPRDVVASDGERAWRVDVPRVDVVNPVGSGDAFNAGFSLTLLANGSIEAALARGVAAGTANALALSGGMLDAAIARGLEHDIRVETIDAT
jgi:fructose-1-phosphate kinase PfkB-like protein